MTRVLVVDDHAPSADSLAEGLGEAGYEVCAVYSAIEASARLAELCPDVIVSDLRMEGLDGLGFLKQVRAVDPFLPVILITAYATIDKAVEATLAGAFSFLTKPARLAELEIQVRNAATLRRLHVEAVGAAETDGMIAASREMREVLARCDRAAASDANVLVTGETGTGKELVARRIHARSARAGGPLVCVNAGALPDSLLEVELFGHSKGAFTGAVGDRPGLFEAAHDGTLFLDEVGELSPSAQTRLLRVLEDGSLRRVGENRDRRVNVRVVAATHRSLSDTPTFRRDLYFRLNVIPVELPPLRARGEDVLLLFGHALRKACRRAARPVPTLTQAALDGLLNYTWPGNVRELINVAERVAVLTSGERIHAEDLPIDVARRVGSLELPAIPEGEFDLTAWLEGVEERMLRRALDRADGVKARAAASLGLERNAFRYKLKKYGLGDP